MSGPRVFREVPITSEVQARQLPQGTVIHRVLKFESVTDTITQPEAGVKVGVNAWNTTGTDEDAWDYLDRQVVGWIAMVLD